SMSYNTLHTFDPAIAMKPMPEFIVTRPLEIENRDGMKTDSGLIVGVRVRKDNNLGVVVNVGKNVTDLKPGDIVLLAHNEESEPYFEGQDENNKPWHIWHKDQAKLHIVLE